MYFRFYLTNYSAYSVPCVRQNLRFDGFFYSRRASRTRAGQISNLSYSLSAPLSNVIVKIYSMDCGICLPEPYTRKCARPEIETALLRLRRTSVRIRNRLPTDFRYNVTCDRSLFERFTIRAGVFKLNSTTPKNAWTAREVAALILGLILLAIGAVIVYAARRKGIDDFKYLYGLGRLLLIGRNAYQVAEYSRANLSFLELVGQPYPPVIGMLVAPFALLPYKLAVLAWTVLTFVVFAGGIWALCRLPWARRHPAYAVLIVGICVCTASFRHGMTSLQVAPIQVGLLGFFIVALERKHSPTIFLWALLAMSLKFTNALPFLGLLALRRQYLMLVAVTAAFAGLNVIGFAWMGGLHLFWDYAATLKTLEQFSVNSPNPYVHDSMIRMDWEFLLNFLHVGARTASIGSKLLALVCLLWIVVEGRRAQAFQLTSDSIAAFAVPLACLSMLCVYHHHYEGVFFIPMLLLYAASSREIRSSPAVIVFAIATVPFVLFYSVPLAQPLGEHFGPFASALYKTTGAIVASVAMVSSLVILRSHVMHLTDGPAGPAGTDQQVAATV